MQVCTLPPTIIKMIWQKCSIFLMNVYLPPSRGCHQTLASMWRPCDLVIWGKKLSLLLDSKTSIWLSSHVIRSPAMSFSSILSFCIQFRDLNKTSKDDTILGTRTKMVGYQYNQYRLSHSPIYQWCFWLIINVYTTVVWWEHSKKKNGFSFIQMKVPKVKWWRISVHTEFFKEFLRHLLAFVCISLLKYFPCVS